MDNLCDNLDKLNIKSDKEKITFKDFLVFFLKLILKKILI